LLYGYIIMQIETKQLQDICCQIAREIDAIISIFADRGEIIASSRRKRIGLFHEGVARVMAGEIEILEVTKADSAGKSNILEGCCLPIEFDGHLVFCVGVAAPLEIARPYARLIQHWVASLLKESALAWSEQRFRDVAESAGDWIWEMNEELHFTYLSQRFFEVFLVAPDVIIGKSRAEFAVKNGPDQIWQDHEATLEARLPFRDFTYSATTADGRIRHVKISGKPIYDGQGIFRGYRGTGSDHTEQIEAEHALKRSQLMLNDAIETIPEGFSLYDKDDRLIIFNSKYMRLLYPDGDIEVHAGMTFEAIARQAAEKGHIREATGRIDEWVQERLARRHELREPHVQQRGEGLWILVSEHRTTDGGTVAVYSDITELKQREQELAEKSNALEQLSSQLAKYLSPQVYESIFTGRQEVKVTSKRKKLTVFFSDIADFTETADRLQSEELTELLNHYLTEMSQIALEFGATIDKYVGDAILIFFGDPETRGIRDDALLCVKMAIAMRKKMEALQIDWRNAGIEKPLQCRIGIHSDYCTVGNFGSESRMDYTIIGSGVNLASRLETAAKPGDILVSYETFAQIRDEIACVEADKIRVKGFLHPIATYRVLDLHENLDGGFHRIREEYPNMKLKLNPGGMSKEERNRAAVILRRALNSLSIPLDKD
jgi:PAS domain S-box-containing protein